MRHTQTAFFYFFSILLSMNIFANIEMLKLDPGFKISIFASDLDQPRQMIESKNGTIFIGERSGQIIALLDSDGMVRQTPKELLLMI